MKKINLYNELKTSEHIYVSHYAFDIDVVIGTIKFYDDYLILQIKNYSYSKHRSNFTCNSDYLTVNKDDEFEINEYGFFTINDYTLKIL